MNESILQNRIDTFWKDLDDIRNENQFKKTAFINATIPFVSGNDLKEHSKEIYDELSFLVYDIEDKRRQHRHYLTNIQVFDVTESAELHPVESYHKYNAYLNDIPSDQITVATFLNALIHQVCDDSPSGSRNNSLDSQENITKKHSLKSIESKSRKDSNESPATKDTQKSQVTETPSKCTAYDKIIFEYQDELIQRIYDKNNMNYENYITTICSLTKFYEWNKYWENIPNCENLLSSYVKPLDNNNIEYALNIINLKADNIQNWETIEDIIEIFNNHPTSNQEYYIDLLTAEALQQQMVKCKQQFDSVTYKYILETDSILIQFKNNKEIFKESTYQRVLRTKLCFRDFIEYVMVEEKDWLNKEEDFYDQRQSEGPNAVLNVSHNNPQLSLILNSDFYLNRSLKKHGNDKFTDDYFQPPQEITAVVPDIKEGKNAFVFKI